MPFKGKNIVAKQSTQRSFKCCAARCVKNGRQVVESLPRKQYLDSVDAGAFAFELISKQPEEWHAFGGSEFSLGSSDRGVALPAIGKYPVVSGSLFQICFCSLDVHGGRQHPAYDQIAKLPQGVLRFKRIVWAETAMPYRLEEDYRMGVTFD